MIYNFNLTDALKKVTNHSQAVESMLSDNSKKLKHMLGERLVNLGDVD